MVDDERSAARAYALGCLLVIAGGLVLSLGVIAIRRAETADSIQYLFWRAIGFTIALLASAVVIGRVDPLRSLARLSPTAWIGALSMMISAGTFVAALRLTTVAETYLLAAMAPLVSAALAGPVLGERSGWLTYVAIALGCGGVAAMAGPGLGEGDWTGRVLALVSCIAFAGYMLSTRRVAARELDLLLVAYGIMTIALMAGILLLRGVPLVPTAPLDAAIATAHGMVILSLGLWLFARGSRFVPAVTLTMLAQVESIASPVVAYFFQNEVPKQGVVIGGCIVLAALLVQALDRQTRRTPA
jgi:drug/metabolite transporter (DMT)-like permease